MLSELNHFRSLLCLSLMAYSMLEASAKADFHFDEKVNSADREQYAAIFQGVKFTLQSIRSGVVRGIGRKRVPGDSDGPTFEGESSFFCAFDFDQGRQRFDRKEESAQFDFDRGGEVRQFKFEGRQIVTPSRVIDWSDGNPTEVHVVASGQRGGSAAQPFDPRIFGIAGIVSVQKNVTVESIIDNLSQNLVSAVVHESDDVFLVSYHMDNGNVILRRWFDSSKGFAPIRSEVILKEEEKPARMLERTSVTYQKVGEYLVYKSVFVAYEPDTEREESISYDFEWESVNEPVSEALFTEDGLKVTGLVDVVDLRLGRPVVVRTLNQRPVKIEKTPVVPRSDYTTVVLWNLGLLLVVGAIIIYRLRLTYSKSS